MRIHPRGRWIGVVFFLSLVTPARGDEPLVVKGEGGKFLPAAASEWTKVSDRAIRFVLKAGKKAPDVVLDLQEKILPLTVEAPDDCTLLFKGDNLQDNDLLEKLSGIALSKAKPAGDALAALADLGSGGGPALNDMSSAGSIRASKKIAVPPESKLRDCRCQLVGQVIGMQRKRPLPTLRVKVVEIPQEGSFKDAFKAGQSIWVRGFVQLNPQTQKVEEKEARTQINLSTKTLKVGDQIVGKPMQQDGKVWVFETIERK